MFFFFVVVFIRKLKIVTLPSIGLHSLIMGDCISGILQQTIPNNALVHEFYSLTSGLDLVTMIWNYSPTWLFRQNKTFTSFLDLIRYIEKDGKDLEWFAMLV